MKIDFNVPFYGEKSGQFVNHLLSDPNLLTTEYFSNEIKSLLEKKFGFKNLFLTSSCSSALFTIALTIRNATRNTVIVPSYTFTTTAAVFEAAGFRIRYADIAMDTLCLNVDQLDSLMDETVAAVVNVNYAGYIRNHSLLRKWCDQNNVLMVEDAAHGLNGSYLTQTGQLADFVAFSFHSTKNVSCGEGGALLVNNLNFLDRAICILNKGTNRHNFLLGKVDKYEWVSEGSNFRLSEFLSAILLGSFLQFDEIIETRKTAWNFYIETLTATLEKNGWLTNPGKLINETLTHHIFYLLAPSNDAKKRFFLQCKNAEIPVQPHYPALHLSSYGKKYFERSLPVTEKVVDTIIRLPMHSHITHMQLEYITESISNFMKDS